MPEPSVLIVGAGIMGRGIALRFAMHGCDVHLHDPNPTALQEARNAITAAHSMLVEAGAADDSAEQLLSRIDMGNELPDELPAIIDYLQNQHD